MLRLRLAVYGPVFLVLAECPAVAAGQLWHDRLAFAGTREAEDVAGEVQFPLHRPQAFMLMRREQLRWVADRDPSDRHRRVRRQMGPQMDQPVDTDLAALAAQLDR